MNKPYCSIVIYLPRLSKKHWMNAHKLTKYQGHSYFTLQIERAMIYNLLFGSVRVHKGSMNFRQSNVKIRPEKSARILRIITGLYFLWSRSMNRKNPSVFLAFSNEYLKCAFWTQTCSLYCSFTGLFNSWLNLSPASTARIHFSDLGSSVSS